MHESAKANGRVPLPHIPVSYSAPPHPHVSIQSLIHCMRSMKPDGLRIFVFMQLVSLVRTDRWN